MSMEAGIFIGMGIIAAAAWGAVFLALWAAKSGKHKD